MRAYNVVLTVLFMMVLFLPLLFVDFSKDRVSVQENRMLANFPKLTELKLHPDVFFRNFDDWFSDSIGFREQLLALFHAINKNTWLNGISYYQGKYVKIIGEEGHHFFADQGGKLIHIFQGKNRISDEQLEIMAVKLEEVKTYLDSRGIPLILMLCTDKEYIYPEYYPKSIKPGPEPIQLDIITRYLQEHTTVDLFNIRQALLEEKNNFWLYDVSSGDLLHYNEIGAFFAYRELMRHINNYFPEIIPYELGDVKIEYDHLGIPNVSLKGEKTYRRLDNSFFDGFEYISDGFGYVLDLLAYNVAFENTKPDLPVILVFRDSFSNEQYIGKYIAQHFGKAIFIHYKNIVQIYEFIDKHNPDIVMFETAERPIAIETFIDSLINIPVRVKE